MKITTATLCAMFGLLTISNALYILPPPVRITASPTEVVLGDSDDLDNKSIFMSIIRAKLSFCSLPGMACMGKRDATPLDTTTTDEKTKTEHLEQDLRAPVHPALYAREAEAQPDAQDAEPWSPRVRVGKCNVPGSSCII